MGPKTFSIYVRFIQNYLTALSSTIKLSYTFSFTFFSFSCRFFFFAFPSSFACLCFSSESLSELLLLLLLLLLPELLELEVPTRFLRQRSILDLLFRLKKKGNEKETKIRQLH